jgi:twinkle protein
MGEFLYHTSCPRCGSKDNVAVWRKPDGSLQGKCFTPGCDYFFVAKPGEDAPQPTERTKKHSLEKLLPFEYKDLPTRGISAPICRAFLYGVTKHKGEWLHVANYLNAQNEIICQKIRTQDKRFWIVGDTQQPRLMFGQHLWHGGGKVLVIAEGEIDAMSIAEATHMSVPVVSVTDGASSAARNIKQHIDWIESFQKIVLAFDNDQAGKAAIDEAVKLLTPGKVYVVNWGKYKDANEVLLNEGGATLAKYIERATPYTPEGVVLGSAISYEDVVLSHNIENYEFPYPGLNMMLKGLRKKELTVITAGTGVGKSTFVRELAYHLVKEHSKRIGYVALEESIDQTVRGFVALHNNIPRGEVELKPTLITPEMFEQTKEKILNNCVFFQHFGSLASENLMTTLRYLAVGLDVDFIIIDHISIVVSGLETHDERKLIDILMTRLRQFVENTGVGMVVVSHIRKSQSQETAEEGRRVTLDDLRGSGSIKQLADNVIAIEVMDPTTRLVRVLKNRLFGVTGEADILRYNRSTGRLEPYAIAAFDNPSEF